jgi:hypothetical protein
VQGLDFEIEVNGRRVKALVLAEMLMHRYGASHEPKSWLDAFERNEREIRSMARRRFRFGEVIVVVGLDAV